MKCFKVVNQFVLDCVFFLNLTKHILPANRSVQNAMWPLRKMVAATTWCVGTKTVKLSSAGFAWVHGNLMAQHGIDIYLFFET